MTRFIGIAVVAFLVWLAMSFGAWLVNFLADNSPWWIGAGLFISLLVAVYRLIVWVWDN